MSKIKVLFVCIHNSGRSQMAEAYLNHLAGDRFAAESAGIAPGVLNPVVVKAMHVDGIDISNNRVKSCDDMLKTGKEFDYVITVCDKEAAEKCPVFPGPGKRLHWSFPDPAAIMGGQDGALDFTIQIREMIKAKIKEFISGGAVDK